MSREQELVLRWFDKVILGVVVAVTIGALVVSFGSDDQLAEAASEISVLNDRVGRLAEIQAKVGVDEAAVSDIAIAGQVDGQIAASAVPSAEPFPVWAHERRPYCLTQFRSGDPGRPAPFHGAPSGVIAQPEHGQVTVRWAENVRNAYVDVKGYEIERRAPTETEWTVVGRAGATELAFVDDTVGARRTYLYRVSSVATEDALHPRKPSTLPEDRRILVSDSVGPVETPRDLVLVPQFVEVPDPIAQPDAIKRARIVVHRWRDGAWTKVRSYLVAIDEEIGDADDDAATLGRSGKLERFTTGAVLVDCGSEMRKTDRGGFEVSWEYRFVVVRFGDREERFDNVDLPEALKKR